MKHLFRALLAAATAMLLLTACLAPAVAESLPKGFPPNPIRAQSEAPFAGHWALRCLFSQGRYVSADASGLSITLDISEGSVGLTTNGYSFKSDSALDPEGTLKITDADGTVTHFNLNDDGSISCLQNMQGIIVVLYFDRRS
ncbi:MAG: hypothetical protein IJJ45_01410 [Clostridia bacterium]|nr:hypothetical protein [Clostridia bacterium]